MPSTVVQVSHDWSWFLVVVPPDGPTFDFEGDDLRITEWSAEEFTAHYELYLDGVLLFEFRGRTISDDGHHAELWVDQCTCQNRSTLF